jgi:pseudouridine synthase
VTVNGIVVRTLGARADASRDVIAVDGERIATRGVRRTIVLHKPRGVVSTLADPAGRPTVAALVSGVPERVYPIGRLDVNTTGLLLLTNDGALAAGLLHPRQAVARQYRAKVHGTPGEEALARLRRGVRLEDGRTGPAQVRVVERLPTKTWLDITVTEGRSRLVRRMCAAIGHPVDKLARVRVGPLVLGDLPIGAWRELTARETEALRGAAGLTGAAAGAAGRKARGRRGRGTPRRRSRGRPESPPTAAGHGHESGPRRPRCQRRHRRRR